MKYIIIFFVIASSVLGYKFYHNVISQDVQFGMGNLVIHKQGGEDIKVKIQIADSINERSKGLMFVKDMGEDQGMLFIFENEQGRKMWMENTYISLDMLFVDKNKEIFYFKENAEPLSRDIIYSAGPAQYVVELKAGFIKKHKIQQGDKIDFDITE